MADFALSKLSKANKRRVETSNIVFCLVFLVPLILLYFFFRYWTSFESILGSFFSWNGNKMEGFIAFNNYTAIFQNPTFWKEMGNTLILFAFQLLFGFWVPILQALLIDQLTKKWKGCFKFLLLLPAAIPAVAGYALWSYIWNVDYGLANTITQALGMGRYAWLQSPDLVKFCLRFPAILGGGIAILIYLVGIDNIPQEMYESAKIDGCSALGSMFRVTLPNLKGVIGIQFLLALTTSLLSFDDVFVLTQGGPSQASETLVMGVYNQVYVYSQNGIGMATSVIILIITTIFSVIQVKASGKKK